MCPQFTVLLARTLPEWYGEHSLNRFSVPMLPNTLERKIFEFLKEGPGLARRDHRRHLRDRVARQRPLEWFHHRRPFCARQRRRAPGRRARRPPTARVQATNVAMLLSGEWTRCIAGNG